jgi:hypothetical protein
MNTLILLILKWLGSVTSAQWARAVQLVVAAATQAIGGAEKRQWVVNILNDEGVKGWIANTLSELAVGYAKRKKLIP